MIRLHTSGNEPTSGDPLIDLPAFTTEEQPGLSVWRRFVDCSTAVFNEGDQVTRLRPGDFDVATIMLRTSSRIALASAGLGVFAFANLLDAPDAVPEPGTTGSLAVLGFALLLGPTLRRRLLSGRGRS